MSNASAVSEHWDRRYQSGDTPWESGLVSRMLVEELTKRRVAPCRAFELGCGTGRNSVWLARQGFDVIGADCSQVAIEQARGLARDTDAAAQFIVADLCRLSEVRAALQDLGPSGERPYSFIFDRGCYHCARRVDLAGFLETVNWLAAPDARLLVLCGNADDQTEHGPPKVTQEEIRAEWGRFFALEDVRPFRFEDRGGAAGPLGWCCWLTRRAER